MNKPFFIRLCYGIALLSLLTMNACKKDDDHDHSSSTDSDKPVITMSSPSDSMMYNNGDTMYIKGTVTDNSLHELLVTVTDANDSILYSQAPVVHDLTSYTIDMSWKTQVGNHTNASIIVVAEDHNANISSDTIHVHIMP